MLSRRLDPPASVRRGIGASLLGLLAACVVAASLQWAPPWAIVVDAVEGFKEEPAATDGNLNERLFDFSGSKRIDLWRVALSTADREPVLGVGAGTFERYWQRDARWSQTARDAHNLYLETLAELGPLGLGLLLGVFATMLVALVRARRARLVPAALGAFCAYLVHAGVDWDWELPGVTLAALFSGSLGLVAARRLPPRGLPAIVRAGAGAAVVAAMVVAVGGFVGNDSLERAEYALQVGNPAAALKEAKLARRFAPWSPYPHTVQGEALLALADRRAAQGAFRSAIEVDDEYWRAWLGLGVASTGRARTRAIHEAKRLYPRSAEIVETLRLLKAQGEQ